MSVKTIRESGGNGLCSHRFKTTKSVLATGMTQRIAGANTYKVRKRECKVCGMIRIQEVRR